MQTDSLALKQLHFVSRRCSHNNEMSYMRGDLLTRTRKLVKGLAKPTPVWLKAMEQAPPVTFPQTNGKMKKIVLDEDIYVKRFYKMHPSSLYHDDIEIRSFAPPPARVFASRVLELKSHGVDEHEAISVADFEYMDEKKQKKKAFKELKEVRKQLGKKPPKNPFGSAVNEIQKEERKLCEERFFNPKVKEIVDKMKEERDTFLMERNEGFGGMGAGGFRGGFGPGGGFRNGGGFREGGFRNGGGFREGGFRNGGGFREGGFDFGGGFKDGGFRDGGFRPEGGFRDGGSGPEGGFGSGGMNGSGFKGFGGGFRDSGMNGGGFRNGSFGPEGGFRDGRFGPEGGFGSEGMNGSGFRGFGGGFRDGGSGPEVGFGSGEMNGGGFKDGGMNGGGFRGFGAGQ